MEVVIERPTAVTRRGRILVVDDDTLVAKAMSRLLAEHHEVLALTSAGEALARLERGERFDLIFCDYRMVGKTGFDLLTELQKQAPQIPVLMVSACAEPILETIAVELGAAGLLRKPFRRQDLVASIARALS